MGGPAGGVCSTSCLSKNGRESRGPRVCLRMEGSRGDPEEGSAGGRQVGEETEDRGRLQQKTRGKLPTMRKR